MRLLVILVCLAPVFAQQPPADAPPPPRQKHGPPKNLKLLDPANLMPTMMSFKSALGVECTHCHNEADFASDEKPQKLVARQMIVMARQINTNFPDGKMHVTCFTCHRGAVEPLTAPAGGAAHAPGGPPTTPPSATPPPAL